MRNQGHLAPSGSITLETKYHVHPVIISIPVVGGEQAAGTVNVDSVRSVYARCQGVQRGIISTMPLKIIEGERICAARVIRRHISGV